MGLQNITLSERNKTWKITYRMIPFMQNAQKKRMYRHNLDSWQSRWERQVTASGHEVCVIESSIMRMQWWLPCPVNILKISELFTETGLSLWYINYASIKLFLKIRFYSGNEPGCYGLVAVWHRHVWGLSVCLLKTSHVATDGQKVHEKMLNITNYQRNANQNYNEVSPHTSQNGHHQKIYRQ